MPSNNDSFSEFIQRIIFRSRDIRFFKIISGKKKIFCEKKKFDKNIAIKLNFSKIILNDVVDIMI